MSHLCALKLTLFFLSLRSDWDVRTSPVPEVGPGPLSALSTDCLGLDQTCPGTATITTTLLPPLLSARPDIISDLVHNDDDNNTMMMTSTTMTPLSSSSHLLLSPSSPSSSLLSSSSLSSSRCTCQHNDSSVVVVGSPARYRVRYREKMRKYHAVIRLNNSNSDLSSLDLSSPSRLVGEEEEEGEGGVVDSTNMYYTLDSRRLANKQKKSLRER